MEFKGLIAKLGIAGYEQIEPPIVVAWALGWPIRLIGKPGTAKTRLADLLSIAENGPEAYRRFDAPKENIVTIAGMPNIEEMKKGIFSFVHETADGKSGFIWDKKNLTFNELTRISAEGANYLLEPLQEGTFFGQPLPIMRKFGNPEEIHTSIIATENPDGVGVKRVDAALFDRFYMAVNVPDGQRVIGRDLRRQIVGANIYRYSRQDGTNEVLAAFAVSLRREYAQVLRDVQIVHPVIEYAVTLWETFFDANQREAVYVSNRRQALVAELILAFAAYQRLTDGRTDLVEAADLALNYGVIVPLVLNETQIQALKSAHVKAKIYLAREEMTPKEKFEAEIQTRPALLDKVKFIRQNKEQFVELLKIDERENILGERILRFAEPQDLLAVHALLAELGGHAELYRKCEVKVIGAVSKAIFDLREQLHRLTVTSFDEMQVFDNFRAFADYLAKGQLPMAVIRLLLSPQRDTLENYVAQLVAACERHGSLRAAA